MKKIVSSKFLERMDVKYHRGELPFIGWLFCDWWDVRIGVGWNFVLRDRVDTLLSYARLNG